MCKPVFVADCVCNSTKRMSTEGRLGRGSSTLLFCFLFAASNPSPRRDHKAGGGNPVSPMGFPLDWDVHMLPVAQEENAGSLWAASLLCWRCIALLSCAPAADGQKLKSFCCLLVHLLRCSHTGRTEVVLKECWGRAEDLPYPSMKACPFPQCSAVLAVIAVKIHPPLCQRLKKAPNKTNSEQLVSKVKVCCLPGQD